MKKMHLTVVLLASLLFGACSSDDGEGGSNSTPGYTETTLNEAPTWQIDWTNNQERPNWEEPTQAYENWTLMKVQIEDVLKPYVTEGDLVAVFVNNELRGVSGPNVDLETGELIDNCRFLIKAWGNETSSQTVNISLRYYCQQLKHIFTLSDNITLDADAEIGFDKLMVPPFTQGSEKYPVVKTVGAESMLTKVGITPVSGYVVGAFVGDECRGTITLSTTGSTSLVIYGRSGESVTLKCYDAGSKRLFTIADAVKM